MSLTGADRLRMVNLTGADLCGATLTDANLTAATLTDADLTGATLTGARLLEADRPTPTSTMPTSAGRTSAGRRGWTRRSSTLHVAMRTRSSRRDGVGQLLEREGRRARLTPRGITRAQAPCIVAPAQHVAA